MKKLLALGFLPVLCAALAVPAAAAEIVVSDQNLTVDGMPAVCAGYNIDGSNYFKLRDLAALLSGTAAQFSVDYDTGRDAVIITTGEDYTPVGGELSAGADESGTAVESSQSILIGGERADGLRVYNIGGSNYFRLRDLGGALGFCVDYDEPSRTAQIGTVYTTWESFSYGAGGAMTVSFRDNNGLSYQMAYAYDEDGVETATIDYHDGTGPAVFSITKYDAHNYAVSVTYPAAGESPKTVVTYENKYDLDGTLVRWKEYAGGVFRESVVYTLGDDGLPLKCVCTDADGHTSRYSYAYDAHGTVTECVCDRGNGVSETYRYTNTYDENGVLTAVETVYY